MQRRARQAHHELAGYPPRAGEIPALAQHQRHRHGRQPEKPSFHCGGNRPGVQDASPRLAPSLIPETTMSCS